ncbi:mRNA turnover and ribosome assembly protein [Exophiala xenobiotica]|nr:mRNA turnover and ribosome assembly protein [Exophiala xenobiotica]KAK5206477.1 mRNA turnover and ribosome assembly protein [Exophiala xenobiotica]KAK5392859.1 mRNA turnover and ribosome assembly protein [Exophiala xenobiotica]KAK5411914.1 mRNA turnover and ribosome assembly protein [Exophiala xenobiotica]KAK5460485.1 mRNA turnover and ribosome assembly protein [Exophiala xenobiotica]
MPQSKRNRIIHTSKTHKNRKELVRRLAANVQEAAQQYNYIWVFSVENIRNNFLKQVRSDLDDSRIMMGKTKVMMVGLGQNAETECVPGVSKLVPYVKGEMGLLFTNREPSEIEEYFQDSLNLDYARSGTAATREVVIPPGQLHTMYGVDGGEEDPLPIQIEPTLRKLGIPTRIVKGKVVLEERPEGAMDDDDEEGYLVCREGDTLDSRQTNILKILGVRMSEFKMNLKAVFDKSEGAVREIGGMEVDAIAV